MQVHARAEARQRLGDERCEDHMLTTRHQGAHKWMSVVKVAVPCMMAQEALIG